MAIPKFYELFANIAVYMRMGCRSRRLAFVSCVYARPGVTGLNEFVDLVLEIEDIQKEGENRRRVVLSLKSRTLREDRCDQAPEVIDNHPPNGESHGEVGHSNRKESDRSSGRCCR